jgi:hypothetical protein
VRHPYVELEGTSLARPALAVQLEDLREAPHLCLVDSGAISNRLPTALAALAGLSVAEALDEDRIVVGGLVTSGRLLRVDLTVAGVRFEAPAWFCDPWPFGFGLLGQEGFFRFFRVTFCAAEGWLDVVPERQRTGGTSGGTSG